MNVSMTLQRYLAKNYLLNLMMMVGILLGIIYLFDTIELLRRASKRGDVPLGLVLQMGLLKLPEVGQIVLPFAVLFSAMFSFWQLNRRHELVILRAAGFSVWQFLAPVVGVALALGVLQMSLINPVGALLLSKFETLENHYLSARKNYVTLLQEGLWLRQMDIDSQGGTGGHVILHAAKLNLADWQLRDVMVLFFDDADHFTRRLDAKTAHLNEKEGYWVFKEVISNESQSRAETVPFIMLPTDLTTQEIEESFASPETVSFWALPGFIKTLEATGFDSAPMKIHFNALLVQPLLFAAMILLAACVSLRPPRMHGTLLMVAGGAFIGFVVFFLSSFLQALGASHQIPVILAAWSPPFILLLLGLSVLMTLEDG